MDVKSKASFSGPMRKNLLSMPDGIGLPAALGIETSAWLFDQDATLLFSTSAVSFTVFITGDNYTGSSPPILRQETLCEIAREVFVRRINRIPKEFATGIGFSLPSHIFSLPRKPICESYE